MQCPWVSGAIVWMQHMRMLRMCLMQPYLSMTKGGTLTMHEKLYFGQDATSLEWRASIFQHKNWLRRQERHSIQGRTVFDYVCLEKPPRFSLDWP